MAGKKGTIVIDPGHGGNAEVGGSSHNNARSPSGVLEKNLTLRMAFLVRDALQQAATLGGHNIKIILTRETRTTSASQTARVSRRTTTPTSSSASTSTPLRSTTRAGLRRWWTGRTARTTITRPTWPSPRRFRRPSSTPSRRTTRRPVKKGREGSGADGAQRPAPRQQGARLPV